MGFLRKLLGLEPKLMRLVSAEIVVDEDLCYFVSLDRHHPDLRDSELVRLVLHYYAKMLFNFDPSDADMALSATMLEGMICKLVRDGIEKGSDIFEVADIADVASMVDAPPANVPRRIAATLFFVNAVRRHIETKVPRNIYAQQAVFSVAALLQATIEKLPPAEMAVLSRSLEHMSAAYASGEDYTDPENLLRIPTLAYISGVRGE